MREPGEEMKLEYLLEWNGVHRVRESKGEDVESLCVALDLEWMRVRMIMAVMRTVMVIMMIIVTVIMIHLLSF